MRTTKLTEDYSDHSWYSVSLIGCYDLVGWHLKFWIFSLLLILFNRTIRADLPNGQLCTCEIPCSKCGNLTHLGRVMHYLIQSWSIVDTLRPRRNRRHFAYDVFKCILLNQTLLILIRISLKFIPNIPALVPKMVWRQPGDRPWSEPMMIILLTHICVIRPQWT